MFIATSLAPPWSELEAPRASAVAGGSRSPPRSCAISSSSLGGAEAG
jgi:hypothetical protein